MATVFWDDKGILLVDFLERGRTINGERYQETLTNLRRAIQNRRRGKLSKGVLLLHDNARPHTARATANLIESFGWFCLPHPPYSPDLAPSDYHLFPDLKKFLGGKRFETDEELKATVLGFFHSLDIEFFENGIKKLILRSEKCIQIQGDYVEKR